MRTLLLLSLLFSFSASAADDAQMLFLGTFHFDNPGLDFVKSEVPDVLSEAKQKEVAEVVERLRKFVPTKIAIEWPADKSAELDRRYAEYRAGKLPPSRGEDVQIGFRLAHLLGHERVYATDVKGEMNLDSVVAAAQKSDPAFLGAMQEFMTKYAGTEARLKKESSLREVLRWLNDAETLAYGHSLYVAMTRVGGEGNYVGADQLGIWYLRNARIFANLTRLTKPGDRVLVLYGVGHIPLLQQLARDLRSVKVVAANDFL